MSSTVEPPCVGGDERVELAVDLVELGRAALLGDEQDEVADQLVGVVEDLARAQPPCRRASSSGFESRPRSSGTSSTAVANSPSSVVDDVERPRPFAAWKSDRAYMRWATATRPFSVSRAEKSSSPIASSISRLVVGRVEHLAGHLLASRSASGRRPRRGSARARGPSRPRSACASPRAGAGGRPRPPRGRARAAPRPSVRACARIAEASLFAWPISCLCSSSSARASRRVFSASSTDERIRSRRSSIVCWIGPNANFFSTKNVIAEADERPDHQTRDDLDQG